MPRRVPVDSFAMKSFASHGTRMAVQFSSADRILFGTVAIGSVVAVGSLWGDNDNSSYYVALAIACCATLYVALYGAELGSRRILSLSDLGARSKGYLISGGAASTLSSRELRVVSVGSALGAFLFVISLTEQEAPWLRYSAYALTVAVSTAMVND